MHPSLSVIQRIQVWYAGDVELESALQIRSQGGTALSFSLVALIAYQGEDHARNAHRVGPIASISAWCRHNGPQWYCYVSLVSMYTSKLLLRTTLNDTYPPTLPVTLSYVLLSPWISRCNFQSNLVLYANVSHSFGRHLRMQSAQCQNQNLPPTVCSILHPFSCRFEEDKIKELWWLCIRLVLSDSEGVPPSNYLGATAADPVPAQHHRGWSLPLEGVLYATSAASVGVGYRDVTAEEKELMENQILASCGSRRPPQYCL
ncbi:hypothetical protein EDD18DRAFT_1456788 [Armillaria luteobubalina]|uniref:Uncharacterized protein n=1 Tax=Armillaria luteobubalina TaxID=153913 RepID=A0AA39QPU5_9AGAR|nr:hypothetical protein EDD18DRAFT_1456788 [Armillaria luteobubalina]